MAEALPLRPQRSDDTADRKATRDRELIPGQTRQEAHWHQRWPGVVPNMLHTGGGSPTGYSVSLNGTELDLNVVSGGVFSG